MNINLSVGMMGGEMEDANEIKTGERERGLLEKRLENPIKDFPLFEYVISAENKSNHKLSPPF